MFGWVILKSKLILIVRLLKLRTFRLNIDYSNVAPTTLLAYRIMNEAVQGQHLVKVDHDPEWEQHLLSGAFLDAHETAGPVARYLDRGILEFVQSLVRLRSEVDAAGADATQLYRRWCFLCICRRNMIRLGLKNSRFYMCAHSSWAWPERLLRKISRDNNPVIWKVVVLGERKL